MLKTVKATIAGVSAAAMLAASSIVAVPTAAQAETGFYGDAQLLQVRHRGDNWRKYHGKRHYKRYHRDNDDFPSGLFFGLAAGALLGSALSQPNYGGVRDWDAYCSRKFRSYKPWTGTYTGYDGYQHRCP
jgi:hypothetical protein